MVAPRQAERLFDLRTYRRNIRSGLITKERYEEWLKTLPDAADNVAPLNVDEDERPRRGASDGTRLIVTYPTPSDSSLDDDLDDEDDEDDLDDEDEDEDDDAGAASDEQTTGDAPKTGEDDAS